MLSTGWNLAPWQVLCFEIPIIYDMAPNQIPSVLYVSFWYVFRASLTAQSASNFIHQRSEGGRPTGSLSSLYRGRPSAVRGIERKGAPLESWALKSSTLLYNRTWLNATSFEWKLWLSTKSGRELRQLETLGTWWTSKYCLLWWTPKLRNSLGGPPMDGADDFHPNPWCPVHGRPLLTITVGSDITLWKSVEISED